MSPLFSNDVVKPINIHVGKSCDPTHFCLVALGDRLFILLLILLGLPYTILLKKNYTSGCLQKKTHDITHW